MKTILPTLNLYFHCALMGRYKEVITEQFSLLRKNNIFQKMKVLISFIGKDKPFIYKLFQKLPCEIIYQGKDLEQFEFPTLKLLQQRSLQEKDRQLVGYIHSKGVSHFQGDSSGFSLIEIDNWRKDMMSFSIEGFENVIPILNGCQVCGWDWIDRNDHRRDFLVNGGVIPLKLKGFFGGNFWWTTNKYIQTLPPIDSLNLKQRCEAEVWIGRTILSSARYFCFKKNKLFSERV